MPRAEVPRDEVVDALLWMYEEHQCCGDPELVEALQAEVERRPDAQS